MPPGGWRFVDPDTDFHFEERYGTFDDLAAHVRNYRKDNELPPLPEYEIEHWLCAQPNCYPRYCLEMTRTPDQYRRGAMAAAKLTAARLLKKEGSGFVDQPTAEARASLCSRCTENLPSRTDSRFKRYTDNYMRSIVGERTTTFDAKLFSCRVCSCVLRGKVHIADNIVRSSLSKNEVMQLKRDIPANDGGPPIHCWQVYPLEEKK